MKKNYYNILVRVLLALIFAMAAIACDSSDGGSKNDGDDKGPAVYTVTFDLNGGAVGNLGDTIDVLVRGIEPGALFKTINQPKPYHMDVSKTFAVWNTEPDGSGTDITKTTPITSNVTFYAIYGEDITNNGIPYIVCNDPSRIYVISNDITVSDFDPICSAPGDAFKGRLYGKGSKVTFSATAGDYAGFFGNLDGAYINELNLVGSPSGNIAAGVLAATAKNSVIENIIVSGTPRGNGNGAVVGGVVGILDGGSIKGSNSQVSVAFGGNNITAGGIVGTADNKSEVHSSYHKGAINATSGTGHILGGIAGRVGDADVSAVFSDSIILASDVATTTSGGIAGINAGTVKSSAAFGKLLNGGKTGRVIGELASTGTVNNVYANSNMLVNFKAVGDNDSNGTGRPLADIKKITAFFTDTLAWDFDNTWLMPLHYEYPVAAWNEPDKYIEISTAQELASIQSTGNYILVADIDLTGIKWMPKAFSGVLDGDNHKITNLNVTELTSSRAGFFTYLENGGVIKDLVFENPVIEVSAVSMAITGVVAGTIQSQSTVDGVTVKNGKVKSGGTNGGGPGGIAASVDGMIINSSYQGQVECTWTDFSTGSGGPGGLVGTLAANSYILFSSFTGDVQVNNSSRAQNVGGLAAILRGTIISSYASANVAYNGVATPTGGIFGKAEGNAAVIGSYATGTVTSATTSSVATFAPMIGGIGGNILGTNVKIQGSVAANTSINVTTLPSTTVTAFAGRVYGNGAPALTDVYADNATTYNINSVASTFTKVDSAEKSEVFPKPQAFYEGLSWNFTSVWKMPATGYHPVLVWEDK